MDPTSDSYAAIAIVVTLAVGRVILSLLPAGTPGRHDAREMPITLAASYLLGSIAIDAEAHFLLSLGARAGWPALAAPWVAVAIVRWITLPGAIVPRRGSERENARDRFARLAGVVAVALVGLVAWRCRDSLFRPPSMHVTRTILPGVLTIADTLSLIAVCDYGLRCARRSSLERAFVALALALVVALSTFAHGDPSAASLALRFGAGMAFAIPWLRRADRRALILSVIAFAGAGLESSLGAVLAFVGLAFLCACTARPSRKLAAVASVIGLSLGIVLQRFGASIEPPLALLAADAPFDVQIAPGLGGEPHVPGIGLDLAADAPIAARATVFLVLAGLFAFPWMLAAWSRWRRRFLAFATETDGVEHARFESSVLDPESEFVAELGAGTLIALLVIGQCTGEFAGKGTIAILAPIVLFSVEMALARAESSAGRA
jgi:hypothetical protein